MVVSASGGSIRCGIVVLYRSVGILRRARSESESRLERPLSGRWRRDGRYEDAIVVRRGVERRHGARRAEIHFLRAVFRDGRRGKRPWPGEVDGEVARVQARVSPVVTALRSHGRGRGDRMSMCMRGCGIHGHRPRSTERVVQVRIRRGRRARLTSMRIVI